MYSRQETSQLKQEFWTTFGKYMSPVLSVDGEQINWINYKTGEKNISFRMNADSKNASIAIELTHKDKGIQQLYYEQLVQLKNIFEDVVKEKWTWKLHSYDEEGRLISKICKEKNGITIFRKEDWPELISFFKPRIIALDEFWSAVKYVFEGLR